MPSKSPLGICSPECPARRWSPVAEPASSPHSGASRSCRGAGTPTPRVLALTRSGLRSWKPLSVGQKADLCPWVPLRLNRCSRSQTSRPFVPSVPCVFLRPGTFAFTTPGRSPPGGSSCRRLHTCPLSLGLSRFCFSGSGGSIVAARGLLSPSLQDRFPDCICWSDTGVLEVAGPVGSQAAPRSGGFSWTGYGFVVVFLAVRTWGSPVSLLTSIVSSATLYRINATFRSVRSLSKETAFWLY